MKKASDDFKFWIHEEYVRRFEEGSLGELRSEAPFRHAVVPNFFSGHGIKVLLEQARFNPTEEAHGKGIAENVDWHWGAFAHLDFIRFYFGKEFRAALNSIMGVDLVMKRKAIPQLNVFLPGSPGIPVHTDLCEQVSVVSLIQLSEGWAEGSGGELIFYSKKENRLHAEKVVQPIAGTLILFEVNDHSFHGVQDMSGTWTRRTISQDWLTREL